MEEFIKGEQTVAPDDPHTIEACKRQGVEPADLVKRPLSSFEEQGVSGAVVQLRYQTHEKQRQTWLRAVVKEYRCLVQKGSEESPGGNSQSRSQRSHRSTASTSRSLSHHVAARQEKALVQFDKVLSLAADNLIETEEKAASIENKHRTRQHRIEERQRRELAETRDQAACKDAWRKSKYDTAQRISGIQLEHHAEKVVEKEHARLRALREREAKFNDKSAVQRARHEQRARSVATTLMEQAAARGEREAQSEQMERIRSTAYARSIQKYKEGLSLRGKQKDMEVNAKRDRVRRMEEEKVRCLMEKSEQKMTYFLHNQLEKQRREHELMSMKQQSDSINRERRLQMIEEAQNQSEEELRQRLSQQEDQSAKAAELKKEEQMIRAEKLRLREEAVRASQQRAQRMDSYRLEQLMTKVEESDKRIATMQEEKQKEMELVRRIKRDSLLKQNNIRQEVKQRIKMKKKGQPTPSPSVARLEGEESYQDDFE